MSLTTVDQQMKDEAVIARVRVALLRWAVARLQNVSRVADQDSLAKLLLRGNESVANTMTRTMLALPTFPAAALVDDTAGDTAMQSQIDTLTPVLLTKQVLVLTDPDA